MQTLVFFCLSLFIVFNHLNAGQGSEFAAPPPHASLVKPKNFHQYKLAICAIFRNEASYLKEWIEFHKLVGVEHFYLYNNLSTDNYLEVLQPYVESGEIDLIEWPFESSDVKNWNVIQSHAYEDALKHALYKVKWLAILDTDEFLIPVEDDSIVEVLKKYDTYGGVSVNWQMYGTSHVEKIEPGQLMVELLTLKAPKDYTENQFVKSIVHPETVERISDPHFVFYKTGFFHINTDKFPIKKSIAPYVVIDKLRINHYWSRDEWFFYNFKCPRRQKWQEGFAGQVSRLDLINQEKDDIMLRFVPALRKAMGYEN